MAALAAVTSPSNGASLRELQAVERELTSPNIDFYNTLRHLGISGHLTEDSSSSSEGAALIAIYERVQSEVASLDGTIESLSRRPVVMPRTIEGTTYRNRKDLVRLTNGYRARKEVIEENFELLITRVKMLLASRDRLRASLETAAPAAQPAAPRAVSKQPSVLSRILHVVQSSCFFRKEKQNY